MLTKSVRNGLEGFHAPKWSPSGPESDPKGDPKSDPKRIPEVDPKVIRGSEARHRIPGKVEFLEISGILQFRVDIAEPIFRNSMIFMKQRGRYGYGGSPGLSPDSEVWAQVLTRGARC